MLQKLFGFDPAHHKVRTEIYRDAYQCSIHSHSAGCSHRIAGNGSLCQEALRTSSRHGRQRVFRIYGVPWYGA